MKHLRLFLALFTLLIGGASASAQTWTGSEVGEGTYYLYNVGADKFLAYGADWGTRAVIDDVGIPVQLLNNNGTYRIRTNVTGTSGKVFLGADFYIDQDPCDFTFTPVANMGEKHVYTLSYMHSDGKTRYRNWVTGAKTFDQVQSVAAGGTWTLESLYWMLISKEERDQLFASGNPMDITYKYIENPNTTWHTGCFTTNNSWQGTGLGGFNGRDAGISYRDRNTEHYEKVYDTYIEATDIPDGKYRFSMAGYYRDGTGAQAIQNYIAGTSTLNAKIYANENTTDIQSIGIGMRTSKAWDNANESSAEVEGTTYYVPNSQEVATFYFNENKYPMQSVDVIVSNGTLRFGMKKETTIAYDWTVFDKFRLTYVDPAISAKAVALPDNGAMVAGQWYYFTIPVEADYTLTSDNLSGIVYTTSGKTTLISEESTVTNVFDAANQTLPAGTYYVKSLSDNNLTMALNAFSYVVGEPTTSIANGATLQSLTTFTATFNDAATNDPDATFALLNNETKALLTKDCSVVAEGTLSLEGQALTATFPETTLELGGAYVLTIPSGVVGYNDQATNEEIIVNISTPAIADGYYFLRDSQGRYVGRGSSYNTRALMEPYGLPLYVETNGEGITTFTFIDSNLKLFDADNGTVYTDNTTNPNWKVEATNDGYYIINKNNNGSYNKKLGTDGGTWMQSNDNGLVWTFEPAAEHNSHMEVLKDQQAATAAAAAGIEGIIDRNSLMNKLESDYTAETIAIDEVAWAEKYQVSAGSEYAGNGVKYYENSISGLKPGLYKLTAKAFYRVTWNGIVDAAAGARGNVYLYGNNTKTQLYSVFDFPANEPWVSGNDYKDGNGKYYPNNPNGSKAAFSAGNYVNELFVYVSADEGAETGTLNYGIHQPSRFGGNGQWCSYQDFTLTCYIDNSNIADDEDYAALTAAINAAEEHALGFEKDEYAPYNNVAALKSLADAKAVDQSIENDKTYVNTLTTALTNSSWVANEKEVNGIYDGTFAAAENNGAPAGWRMSNNTLGGDYHSRAFVGDTRLAEFNETNSGFFMRFDETNSSRGSMYFYGDTEGYTMPLKANTTYYVKVNFAGWGSTGKPLRLNVTGPTGFTSVNKQFNTSVRADNADNTPQQFYIVFTTADAGNYVINFQTPGSDSNTHNVVISNCELFKAKTETVTIKKGFTGTTYSSENALDFTNSGLTAYIITGTEDGKCISTAVTKVPARIGVYVEGEAVNNEADTPYTVIVYGGNDLDNVDNNLLVGTGANPVELQSSGSVTYYMFGKQSGKESFFKVGTETPYTASAHKAYLAIPGVNNAKAFVIVRPNDDMVSDDGGFADGINNVEQDGSNAKIYNLNGQRVNNAQKGIYIKNGKKVIIK